MTRKTMESMTLKREDDGTVRLGISTGAMDGYVWMTLRDALSLAARLLDLARQEARSQAREQPE